MSAGPLQSLSVNEVIPIVYASEQEVKRLKAAATGTAIFMLGI